MDTVISKICLKLILGAFDDNEALLIFRGLLPNGIGIPYRDAERGDSDAQYRLGVCYLDGVGVDRSPEKATEWLHKAAQQGHVNAQILYGWGWKDKQEWLIRAYERSSSDLARFVLGYNYFNGRLEKLSNVSRKGHNLLLKINKDFKTAVEQITKAAENGHAASQYFLGCLYGCGAGIEKSYTTAIEWLGKAARQEDKEAQYLLGICYANGLGVNKSHATAVDMFEKAAGNWLSAISHPRTYKNIKDPANRELGLCYCNGTGVKQSYKKAVKHFRKAAGNGDYIAQFYLGVCYEHGLGVKKSSEEADRWFNQAIQGGGK